MDGDALLEKLAGVVAAVPTPFTTDGEADLHALPRIVTWLLDGGAHGLWVLGSAAEFPALAERQKELIIRTVVESAGGRVPVIAGTASAGTGLAVAAARRAAECGADAVSVMAPYYYRCDEGECALHFRTVSRSTGLPVILYNNPGNSRISISIELVRELSRDRHCRHQRQQS